MPRSDDRRGQLAPVGELIDGVLAKIGGGTKPAVLVLQDRWHDIAGARWADSTHPVKVIENTVIVEVPDGSVASLMRFDLTSMERRMGDVAPQCGVTRITLRVKARSGRKSRV